MKRSEMIAYIQAAEGVPAPMKASAVIGISLMSKEDLAKFSPLADEGLSLLQSKDYDGMLALLKRVGADDSILQVAQNFIGTLAHGEAPTNQV